MNKFLFKSSDADFQKLLQLTNKNILYVTYVVDKIAVIVNELKVDSDLRKQVDKFYDDSGSAEADPPDDKEYD